MPDPTLVTVEGRGQSGKTRLLAWLYERSVAQGGSPLLLDLDTHTPALSALFPPRPDGTGAMRPGSAEPEAQQELVALAADAMATHRRSVFVDTGGGEDRWLFHLQRSLDLSRFCSDVGARRLRLMVLGPTEQDLHYVATVLPADSDTFHPGETVLCLNAGRVPGDRSEGGAFTHILDNPEMDRLRKAGCRTVLVPRLGCMDKLVPGRLTYTAAKAGAAGAFAASMTRFWDGRTERAFLDGLVDLP